LVALQNYSFWDFRKNLTDGTNSALIINSLANLFFKGDDKEPPTYVLLKEKIISDYVGILMTTNHFLFDAYNENIARMVESGIMEMKVGKERPQSSDEVDPTVLSFEHLLIWFEVWIAFLLITSAVFTIEFVRGRFQKRQRMKN
jgi:hypothetical protein